MSRDSLVDSFGQLKRSRPSRALAQITEITIHCFKKSATLLSTLLLVSSFGATNAFASSKSNTTTPISSLVGLEQALAKSIKQSQLPKDLVPTLTQLSSGQDVQGSSYLRKSCDPYVYNAQASDPSPCWYGSSSAKKTVVIFGDSFVGNWIPALNIAGQKLGFRVAEFSFVGCTTPFVDPSASPGFDGAEVKACIVFHKNLPRSVNKLDPEAVIAANGSPSWGALGNPSFIENLGKAFDEMTTASNHPIRILLGTGPELPESAPSCLATHPASINLCNFKYGPGSEFSAALQRDSNTVAGAQVHLIPTYQWLCLNEVCPTVVGHIDVYADADHLTVAISKFLSTLLEGALTPLLNSAKS
jgi:hypothetical protein